MSPAGGGVVVAGGVGAGGGVGGGSGGVVSGTGGGGGSGDRGGGSEVKGIDIIQMLTKARTEYDKVGKVRQQLDSMYIKQTQHIRKQVLSHFKE